MGKQKRCAASTTLSRGTGAALPPADTAMPVPSARASTRRGGSIAKSRGGPGERDAGRLRPAGEGEGAGGVCPHVCAKRGSCGFFELQSSIPVG